MSRTRFLKVTFYDQINFNTKLPSPKIKAVSGRCVTPIHKHFISCNKGNMIPQKQGHFACFCKVLAPAIEISVNNKGLATVSPLSFSMIYTGPKFSCFGTIIFLLAGLK